MVNINKNDTSRERILAAAKKVFMQKGMSGARMQDIADEAGINKALLHYYFRTKEKLFETILKNAIGDFFPKIEYILDSELPLFEKIEQFCTEYISLMQQNIYLPLFVLNEVNKQPNRFREKFWKNRKPLFINFVSQIDSEIKKRNIKPVDPGQLFLNMISMCIFPFIAKPMWIISTGMSESQLNAFMEARKSEVPKFIIESIKK